MKTIKINDNEYFFIGKKRIVHYKFEENKMFSESFQIKEEEENEDFEKELAEKVDKYLQTKLFAK